MKRVEQFNFGTMVAFNHTVRWAMETGGAVDFKCCGVSNVPCEQCPLYAMHEDCYTERTAKEWLDWLFGYAEEEDAEEDAEEEEADTDEEEGRAE